MFLVSDNIHGLNPAVSESMRRLDPKPIKELARRCERSGAHFIDINPGYLSRQNEDRMVFLVETVQEVVSSRLFLDSPNPRVLRRGLSVCRGRPILNGLSREERKLAEIPDLAMEYHAELVILLMDERSTVPGTVHDKIALAVELREHALNKGMSPEDLIFDPVLPNLSWEDAFEQMAEVIQAVRFLSSGAIFQEPTRTIAGISNLRSGFRSRYPVSLEVSCLTLLAGAGLAFALADATRSDIVAQIELIRRLSDQ